MKPTVTPFFDEATVTASFIVTDPKTNPAASVDSVLDFDYSSGRTDFRSADAIIEYVRENDLTIDWILETHVHADHLTGAPYLRDKLGGTTAIGGNVTTVQEVFKGVFNLKDLAADGSQFNHLFADGDSFAVGNLEGTVMATPGHTPACVTYEIGDALS